MKETRKQLIEMLSDYMDKTLSEWCLIYWDNRYWKYEWRKIDTSEYWNWELLLHFYFETWSSFVCNYTPKSMKILWHYDITAVLKYIWNKWYKYEWDRFDKTFICQGQDSMNRTYILNKPLNLYSEDEEKDLLKLLKNLWKKN